ncbi:MAG TPA: 3-mercaptopyruvate sulfurtransferase [Gemmatimonadales bacterium]|nr:3-mercaptopyruvate sulfurtransferase [Gemmatimonadales bacterium]
MTEPLPALVSTEWLASALGRPGLRVVDGSWYLEGSGRDAASEYAAGHIPGAVFFDLDDSSDRNTTLPHMLPSAEAFAVRMGALGLRHSDDLVVYDGSGTNLSAPRVWWMFRTFGHEHVAVLDGGLGKWCREKRPIEQGIVTLPAGQYTARLDSSAIRTLSAVLTNLGSRVEQLVDTRSPGRFAGTEPEPRRGLRSGHVPGSLNLPFTELVRADGTILGPEQLRTRLLGAGVDLSRPVVATCGSGTSACALVLGLHLLGHSQTAVYDGAWAEWGSRADTPIETPRDQT